MVWNSKPLPARGNEPILTCLTVRRLVSEEEFKSPTFGVGLEVSVREIGGKTLVPLLNELLSMASESSSATDLKSASAFETASKLTANGIATLGTLDLNKFSGGLKNVSKSTVEGTGLIFQDLVKVVSSPISDPSLEMLILPDADGKPSVSSSMISLQEPYL